MINFWHKIIIKDGTGEGGSPAMFSFSFCLWHVLIVLWCLKWIYVRGRFYLVDARFEKKKKKDNFWSFRNQSLGLNLLSAAHQASLSLTISWSLPMFLSIDLVMLSNHLILCHPLLLCLQSFPASGSFPMNWLLRY